MLYALIKINDEPVTSFSNGNDCKSLPDKPGSSEVEDVVEGNGSSSCNAQAESVFIYALRLNMFEESLWL